MLTCIPNTDLARPAPPHRQRLIVRVGVSVLVISYPKRSTVRVGVSVFCIFYAPLNLKQTKGREFSAYLLLNS